MTDQPSLQQLQSNTPETSGPAHWLDIDGRFVCLLGTAHVSEASRKDVVAITEAIDFDVIGVELCATRLRALTDPDAFAKVDLFSVIRNGQAGAMTAQLAVGSYQQRLAEQLGVDPGADMRAGITAARGAGSEPALLDRDVGITGRRTLGALGWWQRLGLFSAWMFNLFGNDPIEEKDIEALKQGDVLTGTFNELAQRSPKLYTPLIAERDEFMASRLRQIAASQPAGASILAVVGAGHVAGIEQALVPDAEPVADEAALQDKLSQRPPPSKLLKAVPWLILIAVITGFAIGFARSPEIGFAMVRDWLLINGTLAAVGATIALAHPLTIISALLAAPLTSLNPLMAAGMVAGLVECWRRQPRMGDFAALRKDLSEWKGWWRNRVARILLVVALTNLGSIAGTWIAGASIVDKLL